MDKAERYIKENEYEGKVIASVLRSYEQGTSNLSDICFFNDYNIDRAISHLKKAGYNI